jgi:hypothetical protein
MTRTGLAEADIAPTLPPDPPRTRYVVTRRDDVWFIVFEGESFGPYKTEREALLFAVDAARKLEDQGKETEVLTTDENGDLQSIWCHGHDSYPPRV